MVVNNKLYIKQNIIDSNVFVVNNCDGRVFIDKNIYHMSPYFECICIADFTDDKVQYMADQIICNIQTQEIQFLNTRRRKRNDDPILGKIIPNENQKVSLYTFGVDSILLILETEEK